MPKLEDCAESCFNSDTTPTDTKDITMLWVDENIQFSKVQKKCLIVSFFQPQFFSKNFFLQTFFFPYSLLLCFVQMNTQLSPTQAKRIAFQFFEILYNTIVSKNYEQALDFYVPDATFSRCGSEVSEFRGLEAFKSELKSTHEKFNIFETHIKTIDAQPLSLNMIIVSVVVELIKLSNPEDIEMFVHTIVLSGTYTSDGSPPSYHVTNDMIRYVELPQQPQTIVIEKEVQRTEVDNFKTNVQEEEVIQHKNLKTPIEKETPQIITPQVNPPVKQQGPRSWANIVSPLSSTTIIEEPIESAPTHTESNKLQQHSHKGGKKKFDNNRRGGYSKSRGGHTGSYQKRQPTKPNDPHQS